MTGGDTVRRCVEVMDSGESCVLVTLVEAIGSAPQDSGAKMVVTNSGNRYGTVGGGRLEYRAVELARTILDRKSERLTLVNWNLKADVGMTCGGRVKLLFEYFGASDWQIVVFGAGHIAQSLARLLVRLPCQLTFVDPRQEWLAKLPEKVAPVQLDSPDQFVESIPQHAYVLCMTQGHHSDLPVLKRLLALESRFPYLGVIGSKAKAAVLKRELIGMGVDPMKVNFHCPVGLPIGTNHPGEIAVSIAAQLLQVRDTLNSR
jgi:xanthine dehydrogenase accessory factor